MDHPSGVRTIGIAATIIVAIAGGARAENKGQLDKRLHAQLEQEAPAAVEAWDAANAEADRGDWSAAIRDYRAVTQIEPRFDPAFRRLGHAFAATKDLEQSRAAYEKAVELADTPTNRAAYAELLIYSKGVMDQQRGREMAHAAADASDDAYVIGIECDAYALEGATAAFETCTRRVLAIDPDDPRGNVAAATIAAEQGHTDEALAYLERARPGITPDGYAHVRAEIEASRRSEGGVPGWLWLGVWVLAGWAAGLLVLFVAGVILSWITLRTVERTATVAAGRDAGGQRGLRRVYAIVIAIASVYFYVSIPIIVCSVLVAGGGIIVGVLAAGYIAPKLFIAVGLLVFLTVGAVLRSLFVRALGDDPGVRIDLAKEPALRDALAEVAHVVGTREVDAVYLTPGTDIAVGERRVHGRRERRLILGVGVLDGMKKGWLKSILAHEHGHFGNEDTAGGDVALAVRRSLIVMAVRLARSGAAAWYNPAWLFVRMYYAAFLRISQGASRLQEVLADRWAAIAYGSAAFDAGFRHVIARDARFDREASHAINDAVARKLPLANLYHHEPAKPLATGDIDDDIARAMDRKPAPYDSHPAPRQRLAWVAALDAPARPNADDDQPAWSLFADRDAIERRMTDEVRTNVERNHGVRIAAG